MTAFEWWLANLLDSREWDRRLFAWTVVALLASVIAGFGWLMFVLLASLFER